MNVRQMTDLQGRIAVVTGAAGLIGKAHCEALADAGATVIACDLDQNAATAAVEQLGASHQGIALNITDAAAVHRVCDHVHERHGRIDILVNNAAINDMVEQPALDVDVSQFEHFPIAMWRRVLDVNVTGMFLCCQIIGATMAHRSLGPR